MPKTEKVTPDAIIFTGSEARAEACFLVLKIILTRMNESERKRIFAEAVVEAHSGGVDVIMEELEFLFP
ncbi:MAG: hypothetical protein EON93_07340 [Burkholderiales bacterium]|jgi:hypothetical protein|nr:MAG: hypothetical protein EON93_07340 [Burkholderiales bacterium]